MKDINFVPASEYEEILQNVRTIINTLKKTVPMDREFGINGEVIDLPIAAAQAKITGEIVAAVSKYEPRAKVVSVAYEGKEMDGTLQPTVRIKIQ
jgi:hypothetical protein